MKKYSITCITLTQQSKQDLERIIDFLEKQDDSTIAINKSYAIRKALQYFSESIKLNMVKKELI